MKKRKILSAVLSVVMLFTACFAFPMGVLENTLFVSAYEDVRPLPALTGNQRQDFINVARSQIGYTESGNNQNVYSAQLGRPAEAWCGDFMGWCMNNAGCGNLKPSSYPAAKSWVNVGTKVSDPQVGDIVVWKHHVAMFEGFVNEKATFTGGNQSDGVTFETYGIEKIANFIGYYRPNFETESISVSKQERIDVDRFTDSDKSIPVYSSATAGFNGEEPISYFYPNKMVKAVEKFTLSNGKQTVLVYPYESSDLSTNVTVDTYVLADDLRTARYVEADYWCNDSISPPIFISPDIYSEEIARLPLNTRIKVIEQLAGGTEGDSDDLVRFVPYDNSIPGVSTDSTQTYYVEKKYLKSAGLPTLETGEVKVNGTTVTLSATALTYGGDLQITKFWWWVRKTDETEAYDKPEKNGKFSTEEICTTDIEITDPGVYVCRAYAVTPYGTGEATNAVEFTVSELPPTKSSLSVEYSTETQPIKFSWTESENCAYYDLKIYNGKETDNLDSLNIIFDELLGNSQTVELPAGDYWAYVDSVNLDGIVTISNIVSFTVGKEDNITTDSTTGTTSSPTPLPAPEMYGDLDCDSKVEMVDIVILCKAISAENIDDVLDPQEKANADVFADGIIDSADLSVFASAMVNSQLSTLPKLPK